MAPCVDRDIKMQSHPPQAEQHDAQQALSASLTAGFVGSNAFVTDSGSGGMRRLAATAPKVTPKPTPKAATAARATRTNYTPSWKLYKVICRQPSELANHCWQRFARLSTCGGASSAVH
jgi:hypothetical protein